MSEQKFNVSIDGNEKQNLSLQEVLSLMSRHELSPTDYVYCNATNDWQMIIENEEIMTELKAQAKPLKKPSKTEENENLELNLNFKVKIIARRRLK